MFQDSKHDCMVELFGPERETLRDISSYDAYSCRDKENLIIDANPKADP
jgi:hypothetical protein